MEESVMGETCSKHVRERNAHKCLVGKAEGKSHF